MSLPRLLTSVEVSEQTGIPVPVILRAIRRGEIAAKTIGRGYRIAEADVARWIDQAPGNHRAVELAGGAR